MNRFKPGDKARVIGNEWVKCFKPPFWYQSDSGYIMDQDGLPVAEVRGWGTISYQDQAIDLHDQLGEDIAKGLNSVLNDEVIATQGTVPQGTEAGIPEPIEPVQEEESSWISVEDRLPEDHQQILFYTTGYSNNSIQKGVFERVDAFGRDKIFCGEGMFQLGNVSHWMPLPKPPFPG